MSQGGQVVKEIFEIAMTCIPKLVDIHDFIKKVSQRNLEGFLDGRREFLNR
jgi:hypothetical protein